ncbi:MAG: DUF975 family protein [Eubacteriales bacterium]|nr:DUF975 family protein [Eubacteriales bacterium]
MNNIDRSLVKSQAKQIIKNKVFVLFLISAIVLILVNGISAGVTLYTSSDDLFGPSGDNSYSDNQSGQNTPDDFFKYFNGGDDSGSYNYGDSSSSDNPIENFGQNSNQSYSSSSNLSLPDKLSVKTALTPTTVGARSLTVLSIILSPLLISLYGLYVVLIKRDPNEEFKLGEEIKNIFKTSFDATYGHKIVIFILRNLFTTLWTILFIIPGIVYNYSTYFAYQILSENPNMRPTEALRLSKKMVTGNRGELFALDLSFIGWGFLCAITCGIASIYVIPYYFTTQALYYENFKIRALQEGRITEDDFLTQEEKAQKYAFTGNADYYNSNVNNEQTAQNNANYYYNPAQNSEAQVKSEEPNTDNTTQQYAYRPQNTEPPKENEPVQSGEYPSYTNTNENN